MAVIGLEGMKFHAPHGFYPEEAVLGNDFVVDVYIAANTRKASLSDDLAATINYETVYLMVQSEMRKPAQLIETLADRILLRLHDFYSHIQGVRVIVRKLHPPLGGDVAAAYIEVTSGVFQQKGGY
ncbi:MAG: dihydroneopterin aldolase [Saprospiraceae bacterium]